MVLSNLRLKGNGSNHGMFNSESMFQNLHLIL